jgi:hypothetical protein
MLERISNDFPYLWRMKNRPKDTNQFGKVSADIASGATEN